MSVLRKIKKRLGHWFAGDKVVVESKIEFETNVAPQMDMTGGAASIVVKSNEVNALSVQDELTNDLIVVKTTTSAEEIQFKKDILLSGVAQYETAPTLVANEELAHKGYVDSVAIGNIVEDTTPQLGGILDANSHQIRLSKGADVASAAALTLGTDGNYFDITGTTAITSISSLAIGTQVTLHFDAALTLTHHATNLILPGGANITTAAGDEFTFVEYATGNWRCIGYALASGQAVTGAVSTLTTKGDIYTYDTADARLAVGSNNQKLIADSAETTGLKWVTEIGLGDINIGSGLASGTATYGFLAATSNWVEMEVQGAGGGASLSLYYSFVIPPDYKSGGTLKVDSWTTDHVNLTTWNVSVYINGTVDSSINATSIKPTASSVYQTTSNALGSSITNADIIMLKFNFTGSNGDDIRFRRITMEYNR